MCATPAFSTEAPSLVIDGIVFRLADDEPASATALREYVPEGESLDAWTRLIGFRHYAAPETPRTFVDQLASLYASAHPDLECAGHRNRLTGECALDFLLPGDGFVEWDFIRATRAPGGGVDVMQYAMRFPHHGDAANVNDALQAARAHLLPILAEADFAEGCAGHRTDAGSG